MAGGPVSPVLVALKWVDRRPRVDRLVGEVTNDPRTSGTSDADDAALEWALRLGDSWGVPVIAVCAGPEEVEPVLRDALAAGASEAVRVGLALGRDSALAAAAVAAVAGDVGARVVVCGNASLDRGSGAVPAFVAEALGAEQALGILRLHLDPHVPDRVEAWRRLDGGRRERLAVSAPCVLSVEGGSARLRRAALERTLWARGAPIGVKVHPGAGAVPTLVPTRRLAVRPRVRLLPPPPRGDARERILELTGARTERTAQRTMVLEPQDAADAIVDALRAWGELP